MSSSTPSSSTSNLGEPSSWDSSGFGTSSSTGSSQSDSPRAMEGMRHFSGMRRIERVISNLSNLSVEGRISNSPERSRPSPTARSGGGGSGEQGMARLREEDEEDEKEKDIPEARPLEARRVGSRVPQRPTRSLPEERNIPKPRPPERRQAESRAQRTQTRLPVNHVVKGTSKVEIEVNVVRNLTIAHQRVHVVDKTDATAGVILGCLKNTGSGEAASRKRKKSISTEIVKEARSIITADELVKEADNGQSSALAADHELATIRDLVTDPAAGEEAEKCGSIVFAIDHELTTSRDLVIDRTAGYEALGCTLNTCTITDLHHERLIDEVTSWNATHATHNP